MNKLVRGGIVLSIMVTFVAFVYAQTRTQTGLSSAKSTSRNLVAGSFIGSEVAIDNVVLETPVVNDEAKKLVKKTVSSKAVNRGSFTATAYCLRGRTAMGHGVRRGIIAADPRVLKLGSSINLGAGSYSGNYLVSDTGGRIKGRKIDIWVPSCSEARRFGRRTVTIN